MPKKVAELAAAAASGIDPSNDLLYIHDVSAGSSGDRKVTPAALATAMGVILTVNAWADLSALDLTGYSTGTTLRTRYRITAGDGGDGEFYYDSGSAVALIDGMVFAPAAGGGRILRKYGAELDLVRDFGCDPSGVTDVTTRVQAALDFAANPTYGWGLTAGDVGALSLKVRAIGAFKTTATLTNVGVELCGKAGGLGGNFNCDTVFKSAHSGHFMVFDYNNGPYTIGSLRDVRIIGYSETYMPNKKAITAVTDRLNFTVALGNVPTLDSQTPEANMAFFFDNEGRWLGSGRVSAVNGGTGLITLATGTDCYGTVGGAVLRTVDKVVFTPIIALDGTISNFADPAAAGPCAIYCKNTSGFVGVGPRIENVLIWSFHCGLRLGPGLLNTRVKNLQTQYCRFAGICLPRDFNTTDNYWGELIYLAGKYQADFGSAYTNTITAPELTKGTFGWFGVGGVDKVDTVLAEEVSYCGMYMPRSLNQHIKYLFVDAAVRHGVGIGRGYTTGTGIFNNVASIGHLVVQTPLSGNPTDSVHSTDRSGVFCANTDATRPAFLAVGIFAINDGGAGDFTQAFDIATAGGNKAYVNAVPWRAGATTTWYKAATQPPYVDSPWAFSAAGDVVNGLFSPAANQVAMAINSLQTWLAGGANAAHELGDSTIGTALRLTGGSGGADILKLNRPGLPQEYGFTMTSLSGYFILRLRDITAGNANLFAFSSGGDLALEKVGGGLNIKEGTDARMGVATLVAGVKVVNTVKVTANSRITLTGQDNNVTGTLRVSARTAGTSFTITSSNAGDTGNVAWVIFEPSA